MIAFNALQNSVSWGPLSLAVKLAAAGKADDSHSHGMRQMSLKALFKGLRAQMIKSGREQSVTCLITDSRRVVPGSIFFAINGQHHDGNLFIEEAIGKGAVAIVSSEPKPSLCPVVYVQVPNVREALSVAARRFFGFPDEQLRLLGITGTNGKTTVATLTQFLLSSGERPVGLLGTNCYDLGKRTLPSYRTTPESVDICAMLAQMCENGCEQAVMEVTSHGVDQQRVSGLAIECAAFLNLSREHIDYHGDMESYYQAKRKLFVGRKGLDVAVINADDPYGKRLIEDLAEEQLRVIRFGIDAGADISARNIECGPKGTRFELVWPEGTAQISTHLIGLFNVRNILASMALGYASGEDISTWASRISEFKGVEGRVEQISEGQPFQVLVDFAHTDDALNNTLSMLKQITPGRLLTVFGCGGERDREKRPLMTGVVQEWSDYAWATSDNPRKEAQEQIFEDMKRGVTHAGQFVFEKSRAQAIAGALEAAKPGDCVLIAGKGHEAYQDCGDVILPFDDRAVAREWLTQRDFSRN